MPRITVARSVAELERLAPAWDALADAVDAPLFSRPFWCIPWARHLAAGRPEVVTCHEGSELSGLAPVSVRHLGGVELVRFLGHGLGTVTGLVHDPQDGATHRALWAAMLGRRRRFVQMLELRCPPVGSGGPPAHPHRVDRHDVCLTVDCTTSYESYLSARPKKLRENLRRGERSSGGDAHVELVTTPERWHEVRREVIAVFDAAERARPRHHLFRSHLAPFTDELIESSAAAGGLRLFIGRVGDRPVSFGIAFAGGTTLGFWATRFDPEFTSGSVGVRLLHAVIEHGFIEGLRCVDLLLGDQPHKRRWATDSYDTLTVTAAATTPGLRLGNAVLDSAARLRRR